MHCPAPRGMKSGTQICAETTDLRRFLIRAYQPNPRYPRSIFQGSLPAPVESLLENPGIRCPTPLDQIVAKPEGNFTGSGLWPVTAVDQIAPDFQPKVGADGA